MGRKSRGGEGWKDRYLLLTRSPDGRDLKSARVVCALLGSGSYKVEGEAGQEHLQHVLHELGALRAGPNLAGVPSE